MGVAVASRLTPRCDAPSPLHVLRDVVAPGEADEARHVLADDALTLRRVEEARAHRFDRREAQLRDAVPVCRIAEALLDDVRHVAVQPGMVPERERNVTMEP